MTEYGMYREARRLASTTAQLGGRAAMLFDQDGPKIIDVRQRRAGNHGVIQRAEETMRVVVAEHVHRLEPQGSRSLERIGAQVRAGDFFLSVDAVGVARQGVNARVSFERNGKGQQ